MGNCISTFTNRRLDPTDPKSEDICIEDIAHALSMMARANGHFKTFYSVAQHSINCAKEAAAREYSKRVQLACLLHDASEAYLSDITRPVKAQLSNYLVFEAKLQQTIFQIFSLSDLSEAESDEVKEIDDTLLYYEFLTLHGSRLFDTKPDIVSSPDLQERRFRVVENQFLSLFNCLTSNSDASVLIGIDGCSGGWICAANQNGILSVNQFDCIAKLFDTYSNLDLALIDMPVGLPSNKEQERLRPDSFARKMIKERTSTIFPVPCRQAVYAKTISDAYSENVRALGKKFTPPTAGILPKMREVDNFLQHHKEYHTKLFESHPEVCFAALNEKTVLSKKNTVEGQRERLQILARYKCTVEESFVGELSVKLHCAKDDIIDAICLSVTAEMAYWGNYRTLPEQPVREETGLQMQMIIPKLPEEDM